MVGEWREVSLGDVSELVRGVSYRPNDLLSDGLNAVPLLRATNIGEGILDLSNVLHVPSTLVREAQYLRRFDVVLAMSSGSRQAVGRLAQLRRDWTGCVGAFCGVIRPNPQRIHPEYLGYVLHSPDFRTRIETYAVGTAIMNLSRERLLGFRFRLPGPAEQRAIAHILGTLDDKIELLRRMSETLEEMARAIFKSWFVDFDPVRAKDAVRREHPGWTNEQVSRAACPNLKPEIAALFPDSFEDSELGEIPKGWVIGVLDGLSATVLGGDWGVDDPSLEHTERTRCIRGADIPDLQAGGMGRMPVRYLKPSSLEKRRLSHGDLVIEISGGSPTQSTGRPVLVSDRLLQRVNAPLVCSNFCRLLRPKKAVYSKFVYLWLRSMYSADEFLQFENGTTGIKNFAFTLFSSNYKLCIPSDDVLAAFEDQVSPAFTRQQSAATEADTLAALRDTLLPKLISGVLRVPDAERIVGRTL